MIVTVMKIIEHIKAKKAIREYVEEVVFSACRNYKDIKRVMKKIKQRKYTTIEEVDSFLENVYI